MIKQKDFKEGIPYEDIEKEGEMTKENKRKSSKKSKKKKKRVNRGFWERLAGY